MNITLDYIEEIKSLLNYSDLNPLIKRVIDLSLDIEDISYYKKTIDFLDWYDSSSHKTEDVKSKLEKLLEELIEALSSKQSKIRGSNSELLSARDMVKSYKNSAFSLGPISFSLKERNILGLVGENGNGKTTLLRTLCGELKPSAGSVSYHFNYSDTYDLRSKLIYIPQRTSSWSGSLLSNLQFTAVCYGIKGEENELIVQLIIARMGLRKYREYKWKDLSSGYKMRFELARAMLRQPRILLIDEPLANLDIVAQQTVLDDLKDICRSPFRPIGIILSSQQLYEVEKTSDQVIFLKDGLPKCLVEETNETNEVNSPFIIEFESEWTIDKLSNTLSTIGLEKIQLNGGTYVANFTGEINTNTFLSCVLEHNIPISYFRNISNSTRRFFLS